MSSSQDRRTYNETILFWTKEFNRSNAALMVEKGDDVKRSASSSNVESPLNSFAEVSTELHKDKIKTLRALQKEIDDSEWMFE
jgi:hypothetical protein